MSFLRNRVMRWTAACCCLAACCVVGSVSATQELQPNDFAWRASLVMPGGASLARVDVPVQALLRMQSSAAQDLRVFNAQGAVVPFAILRASDQSHLAPPARTHSYPAYPLLSSPPAGKASQSAVEVHVDRDGQHSSAWVHWGSAPQTTAGADPSGESVQAVLFDTRDEKQTLEALELAAVLPNNALVNLSVSSSADLKAWTPIAVKGPVFRFDGADAPASTTLQFLQPLRVQGRYLRLAWDGQMGVRVSALTGRVASAQAAPAPVRAALPPGTPEAANSLSWALPFATPIAAVDVQATQNNTLVPVRIQGRHEAAQPWRALASALVYRLDAVGLGSRNPPTPLHGVSLRGLRVQASQGGMVLPEGLQATVEFAPLQVAFLASGTAPFTLAVGRAQTPSAAVDAGVLGSVLPARLADLPVATVADVVLRSENAFADNTPGWLPAGISLRTALLWLVLLVGVLVLGAVAYALFRQLGAKR